MVQLTVTVQIDQRLAAEVAEVARLLEDDDEQGILKRLAKLAAEIVPGCDEASITILLEEGGRTVETTDLSVQRCADQQFATGEGPLVEALRHREPRRVDDVRAERRWPGFCAVARNEGLLSCLALPVSAQPFHPAGAMNFWSRQPNAFVAGSHDVALLLAAQGGTALRNTHVYDQARQLIGNLQQALASRAVIEQAKGIIMEQRKCDDLEAFDILRRASQNYNIKVRELARDFVASVINRPGGPASR